MATELLLRSLRAQDQAMDMWPRCENTGTVHIINVQERAHKSNEALPARVTVPNHRSDFLEQRRTLSTGHRVMVL